MTDDLFRPSIATGRDPSLPKPWRIGSQFWVAFFGGIFALLAIAWLNVHRLGGDSRALGPRMIALALLAWALVTAGLAALAANGALDDETRRYVRWAYRGGAIGLHLAFARMQRALDRRYVATHDEDYASLWGPGLLAIAAGSLVQLVLTTAVLLPLLLDGEA